MLEIIESLLRAHYGASAIVEVAEHSPGRFSVAVVSEEFVVGAFDQNARALFKVLKEGLGPEQIISISVAMALNPAEHREVVAARP